MVGETIQEVLAELSTDLETVANAVTNKPSRYMDTTLMNTSAGHSFGIDHECVEILLEE